MNYLNESQLMTRAAWLYYSAGLNQEQTSQRMGLTRARVNKLLAQARESGLVSITINDRDIGLLAEEEAIRAAFGLEFCITTPLLGVGGEWNDALERLAFNMVGSAAAQFLRDAILETPDAIIGTGWGRTMDQLARNMTGLAAPHAKFVSLMGSLTSNSSFNPFEVVHALAQVTGAEGYFLPAPFIADSPEDRDVFMSQRGISTILDMAQRADLALVSVGELTETSLLRAQNMIDDDDLCSLREAGAVADTNGIFFDADGKTLDHDLSRRTIAVGFQTLSALRMVLLSAGPSKVEATKAVLRSGSIRGLIIDGDSARMLSDSLA